MDVSGELPAVIREERECTGVPAQPNTYQHDGRAGEVAEYFGDPFEVPSAGKIADIKMCHINLGHS